MRLGPVPQRVLHETSERDVRIASPVRRDLPLLVQRQRQCGQMCHRHVASICERHMLEPVRADGPQLAALLEHDEAVIVVRLIRPGNGIPADVVLDFLLEPRPGRARELRKRVCIRGGCDAHPHVARRTRHPSSSVRRTPAPAVKPAFGSEAIARRIQSLSAVLNGRGA